MDTSERDRFLSNLAAAFLSGEWNAKVMTVAAARATGERFRWVALLAKRALAHFPGRPAFESLLAFIESDTGFARACRRLEAHGFPIHELFVPRAEMHSARAALAGIELP